MTQEEHEDIIAFIFTY